MTAFITWQAITMFLTGLSVGLAVGVVFGGWLAATINWRIDDE